MKEVMTQKRYTQMSQIYLFVIEQVTLSLKV